jgi:hypothetical protein
LPPRTGVRPRRVGQWPTTCGSCVRSFRVRSDLAALRMLPEIVSVALDSEAPVSRQLAVRFHRLKSPCRCRAALPGRASFPEFRRPWLRW